MLQQLVLQLRHPIRQRRIDKAVNDELRLPIGSEVGVVDALLVLGHQHLTVVGIVLGVQDELRVDNVARQRKDVERPMYQVIPFARNVQTANFTIASRLVFNYRAEREIQPSEIGYANRQEMCNPQKKKCIECQRRSRQVHSPFTHGLES